MLKNSSLSKIIETKEWLDVCDIWKMRNLKVKHITFRQQHYSCYIQKRLDYIFVSQNHQELVKTT